jgi:DNA-binding NarL/FixJ family response regulator
MPRLNGIEAAKKLKKQVPAVKLIFVTMHADMAYVDAAFRAGASGYLLKRSAATELLQSVQSVMNDKFYVTSLITKEVVTSFLKPTQPRLATIDDLTTRQHEILQLVAEGLSAKEIADQLKISHRTVEFHKTKIMEQLHVHTTTDLVKYAMAHGLITAS